MKKILSSHSQRLIVILISLIFFTGSVYAINRVTSGWAADYDTLVTSGWRIAHDTVVNIDLSTNYGIWNCKNVTSTMYDVFIPTASLTDWNAFKNNAPNNSIWVSLSGCSTLVNASCSATPGICTMGTLSSDNGSTMDGTYRSWTCQGSGGGYAVGCNHLNCVPNSMTGYGSCNVSCGGGTQTEYDNCGNFIRVVYTNCNPQSCGNVVIPPPVTTSGYFCTGTNNIYWSCDGTGTWGNVWGGCTHTDLGQIPGVCGYTAPPVATSGYFCAGTNNIYYSCDGTGIWGNVWGGCTHTDLGQVVGVCGYTIPVISGVCGTSAGQGSGTNPLINGWNLCTSGTAVWWSTDAINGVASWQCVGSNGGSTQSCSTSISLSGWCSAAEWGTWVSLPPNLCYRGSPSPPLSGWAVPMLMGSTYLWNCDGINGWPSISCQANYVVSGGSDGAMDGCGWPWWSCGGE